MEDFKKYTRKDLDHSIEEIKDSVFDGREDALDVFLNCKKAIHYYTAIMKGIEYEALNEREKYPEKDLSKYDVKISLSSTGERLDYEKDAEYLTRKTALKDREQLIKLAYKSKDQIIDSDGAVVESVPIKTPSKQVIKVIV